MNMHSSEMLENRSRLINYETQLFESVKVDQKPFRNLNLGCGGRLLEGFTNVDKYVVQVGVENYDMYKLPYEDNSKDLILSIHSLEHLPIRHSKLALKEWHRVLDYNGKLVLEIPDLGLVMAKLLQDDEQELSENLYDWYMYTLFGYQINVGIWDNKLHHPIDLGQFHTCGFTKRRLVNYLRSIGFDIVQMYSYDGWDTPSIFVEAVKLAF